MSQIRYDRQYFVAELRCLILTGRSPLTVNAESNRIEAALWRCIGEIVGADQLAGEKQLFERLYVNSPNVRARKKSTG